MRKEFSVHQKTLLLLLVALENLQARGGGQLAAAQLLGVIGFTGTASDQIAKARGNFSIRCQGMTCLLANRGKAISTDLPGTGLVGIILDRDVGARARFRRIKQNNLLAVVIDQIKGVRVDLPFYNPSLKKIELEYAKPVIVEI